MNRRAVVLMPLFALTPLALAARPDAGQPAAKVAKVAKPPATPRKPVTDTYFGHKVVDPFRWLEDWNDPAVKQWSEAQNQYARSVLDALPQRDAIEQRLDQLLSFEAPSYRAMAFRGGKLFGLKTQPPRQQPFVVLVGSLEGAAQEKVLVDPNAIDPSGGTSMDFFEPSHDGRYVAVSLSKGGSESGDAHIFEVATGKAIKDVVPRVNSGTAGGSLAWKADGSGFWYTRHPAKGERPDADLGFFQQVYFHKLGTPPEQDTYAIGKEFPRIAETELETSEDGKYLTAVVQLGDGGQYEVFLLDVAKNAWTKLAGYDDQVKHVEFGRDGGLWAISRKDAGRGKVLRIPLDKPQLASARVVVPEGPATIEDLELTPRRLYVEEQLGGPSRARVFDLAGKELATIPALPVSTVAGLEALGGDDVLFANVSFLEPLAWYRYDAKTGKVAPTRLKTETPIDLSAMAEVVREEATSKDGTKVPVSLIVPKGMKRDGTHPALLTGYGGFNVSVTPNFNRQSAFFVEQGGIVAIANLRGGSEFGEAWHSQGAKTKKQNVFDDFIAVARHLEKRKYTNPKKLAIQGGSNGGLLMGAAMTQAPQLFAAVVAHVGYFDMLRYETRPNGAFNNTEYGTVKNRAEYEALRAYSPYHRVTRGRKYPPALFLTGANDPRVDPLHSRKMVAALQSVGAPALLRTSGSTGHGMGTPLKARIAEAVDVYAFLFDELGMKLTGSAAKTRPTK